mgnify:CR=1 FL=1
MTLNSKNSGTPFLNNEEVKLLDAQISITDGEWHRLKGKNSYTIDFTGIVDSTLEVRCSNDFSDNLANSNNGQKVGADITSNQGIQLDAKVKYIKIRKTIAGTDIVTATLYS